jgi:ELWxxDGT repeat protein
MRRPLPLTAILSFALLLLPQSLKAQPATLARDINTAAGSQIASDGNPTQLLAVQDKLFFVALAGDTGREVWVTNGTTYGTELLADVCPGLCNSNVDPVPSRSAGPTSPAIRVRARRPTSPATPAPSGSSGQRTSSWW